MTIERTVFTVLRDQGQWAVEHQGRCCAHSPDKDIAKAAANRLARAAQELGRVCQVRVLGEHGFLGA